MTTPLHLLAAVASTAAPDRDAVVAAARSALDGVILPALGDTAVEVSLQVFSRGVPLTAPTGWTPAGVDWDLVRHAADPEGLAVAVTVPDRSLDDENLAIVFGGFPGRRRRVDGTIGTSETTVSWSLRRDAVPGGAIAGDVQDRAVAWMQGAVADLEAVAGYLTLDRMTASPDGYSPYEQATYRMAAQREFDSHVWNPVWGVLLTDRQVAVLGGPGPLAGVGRVVRTLPGGGWWMQASEDIEALTDEQVAATRDLLAPVLPAGAQEVTDYAEDPPLRV